MFKCCFVNENLIKKSSVLEKWSFKLNFLFMHSLKLWRRDILVGTSLIKCREMHQTKPFCPILFVLFSPDVEVSRGPQCEHEGGCRGGWLGDRPRLWGTVHFLVHASSLKELFWCRFCVLERRIGAGAKVGSQNHRRFWTHKGTHQVKMLQNSIFCSFCLTMNPYLDWGGTCELEWVLKQEEEVRAEACEASSLS